MKIAQVIIGYIDDDGTPAALSLEPNDGVCAVDETKVPGEEIIDAIVHALSDPGRRESGAIRFVRVRLEAGVTQLDVVADSAAHTRALTIHAPGAPSRELEVDDREPEAETLIEAILDTIADAAGVDEIDALPPLLRHAGADKNTSSRETAAAQAFVSAHRDALRFAGAVKKIDDEMTASVVPDWLWIATGLGGVGVLLTAIVFIYPELRLVLIPILLVVSVIGFSLYGYRALQEMKVRGRLQNERAVVRAQRENARAAVKSQRSALHAVGEDPDAILAELGDFSGPDPLVLLVPFDRDLGLTGGRQVLRFDAPQGAGDVAFEALS